MIPDDMQAAADRAQRWTGCPSCAALRARIEVLENAVEWALTTDQTHQWKAELRRRAKEG
jgi:hypothetical protein